MPLHYCNYVSPFYASVVNKDGNFILTHTVQGLFQNLAPGGAKVQYQNLRGAFTITHIYTYHISSCKLVMHEV